MNDYLEELDQVLDTASSQEIDLNNSRDYQNPEIEKLEVLTNQQLKELRGDLEVELHDLQQELRFVDSWEEEPTGCATRTTRDVEADINYTLDKINTINNVYQRRVEARGETYSDLYYCS